jgi:hypothetical protein
MTNKAILFFTLMFLIISCKQSNKKLVGQWNMVDIEMEFDKSIPKATQDILQADLKSRKEMTIKNSNFEFDEKGNYIVKIAGNTNNGKYRLLDSDKKLEISQTIEKETLKDTFDLTFLHNNKIKLTQKALHGGSTIILQKK